MHHVQFSFSFHTNVPTSCSVVAMGCTSCLICTDGRSAIIHTLFKSSQKDDRFKGRPLANENLKNEVSINVPEAQKTELSYLLLFYYIFFKTSIGFLGQFRKMSSKFNLQAILFCAKSNATEKSHSISFQEYIASLDVIKIK